MYIYIIYEVATGSLVTVNELIKLRSFARSYELIEVPILQIFQITLARIVFRQRDVFMVYAKWKKC